MKLLALDTSSVACSVALQSDAAITERHEERPREHTNILLPMIREVCKETDVAIADLDALVLGNGPGSFIGMRIAASVAQGLAYAAGLRIVPVSSLAAVAAEVFATHEAQEVVVAQDAHMHEVYLGVYRRDAAGLPQAIAPERLCARQAIAEIAADIAGRRVAAGFGWQRYPELLALNRDRFDSIAEAHYPRARYLLDPGAAGLNSAEALDPQQIAPAYLRQRVAEKPVSSTRNV